MKFNVTLAPHIRSKNKTGRIMLDVVIALLPALAVGVYYFGLRALGVTLVSVFTAILAEWLCGRLIYHRNTLPDLSCVVTGMLFAMTLPVSVPYHVVIAGSAFAIVVVKGLGGGLGKNIFNPALGARAFVLLVWPLHLVRYPQVGEEMSILSNSVDAAAGATPLHPLQVPTLPEASLMDMFLGNIGGSIGEICTLALLAGGIYLLIRKVISWKIPVTYLATVALMTLVFHKTEDPVGWMLYSLLGGGLVLGAFFMATDYSSSPVTAKGKMIYGVGCGILTVIFRYYGLYPEGVTYAVLLMNAGTWLIDSYCAPRRFGVKEGGA